MIIFLWLLINRCNLVFFQVICCFKFDLLYKIILFKIFIISFFAMNKINVDMFDLNAYECY